MLRRLRAARRPLLPAALAGAVLVACAACAPAPAPIPTDTGTVAPTSSPAPTAASLVPDGSAEENLPFFTGVVVEVAGAGGDGRAYVDALTAAGFDKSAMELTPDTTTIGNPAESIEFSVRWGEECLVGQVGPAIGDPRTQVLTGLADGRCLIGNTRAIDW